MRHPSAAVDGDAEDVEELSDGGASDDGASGTIGNPPIRDSGDSGTTGS